MFQELENKVLEMNQMIEENRRIIDEQNQKIEQQQILINELTNKLDQFKKVVKDAIEAGVQISIQNQNEGLRQSGPCPTVYSITYIISFGNAMLAKIPQ